MLALIVGYLGLLAGIRAAHDSPASGYELSIYAATPPVTWLGLGFALVVGIVVVLATPDATRGFDAGRLLTASAALAVLTLPIVRGYEFYGLGDALSHVGWSREFATGALSPGDLLYPGLHSLTVATSGVAGVPLTQANLYVVLLLFPLVFLLFVPLTAAVVTGSRRALGLGLLVAVLFTPINNVSIHPNAHPASQTILFVPFVLYLVLRYVTHGRSGSDGAPTTTRATTRSGMRAEAPIGLDGTAFGVVLGLTSIAVVLFHPQQALNVALCLSAVTALQLGASRWSANDALTAHRPLHLQTAIAIGAFLVWAPRFERARGAVVHTVETILGQGPTTGVVSAKSASLTAIGGSVPVLFLKLFLPALVCSILAGALVLHVYRNGLADPESTALVGYLTMVLAPMLGVFLVVLAADSGDMYFRYQGFIMVPVAILAAVALVHVCRWLDARTRPGVAPVPVIVLFLLLVPAGLVAVHSSPYMHQPTPHAAQDQLAGYDAAFGHRAEDVAFTGLRAGPRRYVDFHYGTQQARTTLDFPGYRAGIDEAVFRNASYRDAYEEDRYLAITRSTRERELGVYRGFRYPASGFDALERTPGVNRVRSNDGFTLYYLEAARPT